ncbi:DUF1758 domain-containing protein [Trichonephila clavipes]|uniref:DUF1758 domain-containing protein n=1 Tax=Trichonephila clavipes TaxID=2585209 RepID=A0A8X6V0B1_TRICX|nr:DUF1758 domain-containing protein [Trichonephila clavipes]
MYKNALKEDLIRVVEDLDDERVSRNEREVTLEKQKIELAELQLAKLEKEIELQTAKNKALSLNPAAKVEEKQFETNIENMINSIRTLSLPVPTRSENFNLFFQSLERAFLTKKINDEYKSEILINLLGERSHNVLLRDIHPICCKIDGKLPIYYCSLRKVNSFESLCDLIISDKLFETLNKETATHIGIREAEDWFRPIDLAKECDIYISSRSGSHKEIPITYGYTQDPFKNRSQNFKPKIKENYPQYLERENKNCYICGDSSHCARDCAHAYAYPNVVSVSNVIENSSYDLPYVKNFNTRNDLSSLVKNYKCNNIKSTKLKRCIKLKNDIPVCQRTRRLSCSDNPSPMNSKYRRFVLLRKIFEPWQWKRRKKRNRFEQTSRTLQRKISMRPNKDQLVKKDVLMPVKHNVFLWNLPDVEEVPSHDGETV